ncbi:hypothetical protein MOV08_35275 [Streptomyces yunnanensis]|uniref:Sigma-70, region 4 n=1 Tax=Streptomyces yunnanensis TaxID=156453 RepID=A0ABY8AGU3_9ACTN|nr:hypothetical protein [Streptomyces yunnanensis]WEB44028.1 hypothetical protein MOV08_35275 [Streptomyces yunnanensis]
MAKERDDRPEQYTRSDPSKQPTPPAGQQAAVEGTLTAEGFLPADKPETAEHNRRAADRQGLGPGSATQRFTEQMLSIMAEYEQRRREEIIAAGGDPDEDRDPFETVRAIADQWAATEADDEGRAALLDDLADQLDTTEVRALRLAAEAAAAITPRLIYADADHGVKPADTAADLGVSESYVYRILRTRPAK